MEVDGHLDGFYRWQDTQISAIASRIFAGVSRFIDSHEGEHAQDWDYFRDGLRNEIGLATTHLRDRGLRYAHVQDIFGHITAAREPKYRGFVQFVLEEAYHGLVRTNGCTEVGESPKSNLKDLLATEIGSDPRQIVHFAEFFVNSDNPRRNAGTLEAPEEDLVSSEA